MNYPQFKLLSVLIRLPEKLLTSTVGAPTKQQGGEA